MVSRKIEFHRNKISDGFLTALCNRMVKEWRVTLGIPLAVSTVSSFVTVQVRPSLLHPLPPQCIRKMAHFFPRKLLIISCSLHTDIEIHS